MPISNIVKSKHEPTYEHEQSVPPTASPPRLNSSTNPSIRPGWTSAGLLHTQGVTKDLSREANVLASSTLLPPPSAAPSANPSSSPSSTQTKPKPRQNPSQPAEKGAWTKGFLTTTHEEPVGGGVSPKDTKRVTTVQPGMADVRPKQTPFEMRSPASKDREQHTVELEDGEEDPIIEIKEWLDDSGKQTSVDVTDLGKVMRKAHEGVAEPQQVKQPRQQKVGSTDSSSAEVVRDGTGPSDPSDLDSVFARLEQEEASAQEQTKKDSSLSLGPKWKKGFLSGGTKRGATPESTAKTAHVHETKPATLRRTSRTEGGGSVPGSLTAPTPRTSNPHAFEGVVVEKAVNAPSTPTLATTGSSQPIAAMPPRVSRFKARRQGLQ